MSGCRAWLLPLTALLVVLGPPASASLRPTTAAAVAALESYPGEAEARAHPATGVVRFLRLPAGRGEAAPRTLADRSATRESLRFLAEHRDLFGLSRPEQQLVPLPTRVDRQGGAHVSFRQVHQEVPVFGALLLLHYDRSGSLVAVNGTVVPDLDLPTRPTLAASGAREAALARAARDLALPPGDPPLLVASSQLVIHHAGLARDVVAVPRLAWKVEVVGSGSDGDRGSARPVRDWWMVDAHTGEVFDRLPGIHEGLRRELYHRELAPEALIWDEGDPLPFTALPPAGDAAANRLLSSTADTHRLFANLTSGSLLSYDGNSATMKIVHDTKLLDGRCPNAFWDGTSTQFCPDTAIDDVIGHEWTHAYTEHSHELIYQWQPGALNEAYSDIFGEVVDLLDGEGTDEPNLPRLPRQCSNRDHATLPVLRVLAPAEARTSFPVSSFRNLPSLVGHPVQGRVVRVDNKPQPRLRNPPPVVHNACTPLLNAKQVEGHIALVRVGPGCPITERMAHLRKAGARAVIFQFDMEDRLFRFSDVVAGEALPAVAVRERDSVEALLAQWPGLRVRLVHHPGADPSPRWLIGEDDAGPGFPFRDMWNPRCVGHPAEVGGEARRGEAAPAADLYYCDTDDNGGVHINSGVINRAFALLVDGGSAAGALTPGLGLTKAAHLYWRAALLYQGPFTDFDEHTAALTQSCADLAAAGTNLPRLDDGLSSDERITTADCATLTQVLTSARLTATACGFRPLLAPDPPALCPQGLPQVFFGESFESGLDGWTSESFASRPTDVPDPWTTVGELPQRRTGTAVFSTLPSECPFSPGPGPRARLSRLTSPVFTLPVGAPARIAFDHWLSIPEKQRGGANLKVSVNGGPFTVVPGNAFVFNGYNATSYDASGGAYMPGEPAWVGQDEGSPGGSWGQTQIDLSRLAAPGDRIQLRFDYAAWLHCFGPSSRWYVDDLRAFTCG